MGTLMIIRPWLTHERLVEKRAVTNAPVSRHSSFRFVAGELIPGAEPGGVPKCCRAGP